MEYDKDASEGAAVFTSAALREMMIKHTPFGSDHLEDRDPMTKRKMAFITMVIVFVPEKMALYVILYPLPSKWPSFSMAKSFRRSSKQKGLVKIEVTTPCPGSNRHVKKPRWHQTIFSGPKLSALFGGIRFLLDHEEGKKPLLNVFPDF